MKRFLLSVFFVLSALASDEHRHLLEHKEMTYPPSAFASGITGVVDLQITVRTDGMVTTDSRPDTTPLRILVEACKENVRTWKFEPRDREETLIVGFSFEFVARGAGEESSFDHVRLFTKIKKPR